MPLFATFEASHGETDETTNLDEPDTHFLPPYFLGAFPEAPTLPPRMPGGAPPRPKPPPFLTAWQFLSSFTNEHRRLCSSLVNKGSPRNWATRQGPWLSIILSDCLVTVSCHSPVSMVPWMLDRTPLTPKWSSSASCTDSQVVWTSTSFLIHSPVAIICQLCTSPPLLLLLLQVPHVPVDLNMGHEAAPGAQKTGPCRGSVMRHRTESHGGRRKRRRMMRRMNRIRNESCRGFGWNPQT